MSAKKTRIYPVTSFGPEIMAALLRGARESFAVTMPYNEAVRFHMRVNSLRAAMRHEGHEKYQLVARTKIRIAWGAKAGFAPVPEKRNSRNVPSPIDNTVPAKVIIEPHDREFASALLTAGIKPDELRDDPLDSIAPIADQKHPLSDDYLDQILGTGNSKKDP